MLVVTQEVKDVMEAIHATSGKVLAELLEEPGFAMSVEEQTHKYVEVLRFVAERVLEARPRRRSRAKKA